MFHFYFGCFYMLVACLIKIEDKDCSKKYIPIFSQSCGFSSGEDCLCEHAHANDSKTRN